MDRPLDPELAARLDADLTPLCRPDERLGLAVSGGPDSMALLLLCHTLRPGMIEAATVDHGLRADSAAEAQLVAGYCAQKDIPHEILPVTVASGNVQQEARFARYTALADWMDRRGLDCLATAHHGDDQAETLLMRLNRGSGVAGLAGVRRSGLIPGSTKRVIRPLLGWRKAELVAAVQGAEIPFATDPSNRDPSFDRARLRGQLDAAGWLNPGAMAQSAAHIADADAALEWMAEQEWAARVRRIGARYVYRPHAPRAVRLRVLAKVLSAIAGGDPRGSGVAGMLDRLEQGEGSNVGGVLVTIVGDAWRFEKEPARKSKTG